MKLPSISGLERAEKCPTSAVLHHFDEESDEKGRHGRAVHRYLDNVAKGVPHLEGIDEEHHEACRAIDLSLLPHDQIGIWHSEVALALDYRKRQGRLLGTTDRDYSGLGPTEIAGTCDLFALDPDGETLIVLDVKTGRRWQGRPGAHLQLLGYAAALAYLHKRTRVRVGWLYVKATQNPDEMEPPVFVIDEINAFDLELAVSRIDSIFASIEWLQQTKTIAPYAGRHCAYCPAYRGCPSHTSMLRAFMSNDVDVATEALGGVIEIGMLPVAYDRIRAMERLLEAVKIEVENAIRVVGAVPTRDGKVIGETQTTREKVNVADARPTLLEFFPADEVKKAIELEEKITKKAIGMLVRAKAGREKKPIGALEEEVLEALRNAGAIRAHTFTSVKTYDPKKK